MRHHYIPQFLLAGWVDGAEDGKFQEFRIDLPGMPTSRRVPKATGYVEDLYALSEHEIAGMRRQDIETKLMRGIDNYGARVRSRVLDSGFNQLTPTDRQDLARFIMASRLRQPEQIEKLKLEGSKDLVASLRDQPEEYEALAEYDDPPTLEEWVHENYPGLIENFGMSLLSGLVDDPMIGSKLLGLKWWLWHFKDSGRDLILADNPCIFSAGIDHPNLIVALPLSPHTAFVASRGVKVEYHLKRTSVRELAERINESSVDQARARIYARHEGPRRFIENRLRKADRFLM